jgi:hypothetical protein
LSELEEYHNPNIYEGVLQRHLDKIKPNIVAYKESKVFGVPANRVNDTNANRNGLSHPYTIKELNDMYLAGKIIKVDKEFNITAAQQEEKYEFMDVLGRD